VSDAGIYASLVIGFSQPMGTIVSAVLITKLKLFFAHDCER
jgi:hypothetical protein